MNHSKQIEHFVKDIQNVISRYHKEYDLPLASALGALQCIAFDLMRDATQDDEQDEI